MTTSVRDDMAAWIKLTDEPRVRANRRYLAKEFIGADPELEAEVTDKGRQEGRLTEARRMLARNFAARKLVPTATEQARIDACADLETLERWHDQAVVAATVADSLR
jgi:hypothetical protein